MALKLITAPTNEPVDANYCKQHMRLYDDSLDTLIESYIPAARQEAENYQNRAMLSQTWELSLDAFHGWVELPRPPLQSLESVTLYMVDGTIFPFNIDFFEVDTASEPGRICLKNGCGWVNNCLRELGGIVIRYTAGYESADDLPTNEKLAVAVGVAHLFDNPSGGEFPGLFYNLLNGRRIVPV